MLTLVTDFDDTVTLQVAVFPLSVFTVIFAVPPLLAVNTPDCDTVTTLLLSDDQVKDVEALVGVIVGVRVCVSPTSKERPDGMLTLVTGFAETVTLHAAVLPLSVFTVMLVVPALFAITIPELDTVATLVLLDVQVKVY